MANKPEMASSLGHTHSLLSRMPLRKLLDRIPNGVLAVLLMVLSALFFSVMNIMIRSLGDGLPVIETVAFRNLFGWLFLFPWWARVGRYAFQSPAPKFYILRSGIGMLGMLLMFWSVVLLPAAEAVALNFVMPMFILIGAYFFLGEQVGWRRWAATLVGFGGVVIMLQPGAATFRIEALVPLAAAAGMAGALLCVKYLTRLGEDPVRAVFLNAAISTPLTFLMSLPFWVWPSWMQLGMLSLIGTCGTLAHLSFTAAFRHGDASFLIAFDYLRLPLVALLGFWVLGEIPSVWIWPGAALIAASSVYIAHREAVKSRATKLVSAPVPKDH